MLQLKTSIFSSKNINTNTLNMQTNIEVVAWAERPSALPYGPALPWIDLLCVLDRDPMT
jgi:hypothetical protein